MHSEEADLAHVGGFGRDTHSYVKCANESALGRDGMFVPCRYVRFASSAFRTPAASYFCVWWFMRTILGPDPRRFIILAVRGLIFLCIDF